MKLFFILFAFYFAILGGYPCSDADERAQEGLAIHMQHAQPGADQCSPFCICACCATSVQVSANTILLTAATSHNSKFTTPYLDKHLIHNQTPVWQPPRHS